MVEPRPLPGPLHSPMSVSVFHTISETRKFLVDRRGKGPVILVPTMGALHDGHVSLIRRARKEAGASGTVVVSVFVNPAQFGPNEDYAAYPRDLEADQKVCDQAGADAVLAPEVSEMYAPDHSVDVRESVLSKGLCGMSRPTHFAGVCLVVTKLFNIVQPDRAVFGKKDYQQLAIIRRLVRDLCFPVTIIAVDTYREDDGLAKSSRNQYLSPAERDAAPGFFAALQAGKARWESRPDTPGNVLTRFVQSRLEQLSGARIDYLELVDAETLKRVTTIDRKVVLAGAIFFDKTRLIDNVEFGPEE